MKRSPVASDTLVERAGLVRDARVADLRRIAEIWNPEILGADTTTDTEPRDPAALSEWLARHGAAYPIVVAVAGDAVRAFGSLSPWRPKPAFARTVEDSVYVERGHRNAGLGRLVLAELVARARAAGHHSMLARITAKNAASIRLHQALGFGVVGVEREVAWKLGAWLDVTVLQLPLRSS